MIFQIQVEDVAVSLESSTEPLAWNRQNATMRVRQKPTSQQLPALTSTQKHSYFQ